MEINNKPKPSASKLLKDSPVEVLINFIEKTIVPVASVINHLDKFI
jgi:hypothetical protein